MKKKNELKNSSLGRKILRILEMGRELVGSSGMQEENVHSDIPVNHDYLKETETAFLEAERKKAEALKERQKHSFNW